MSPAAPANAIHEFLSNSFGMCTYKTSCASRSRNPFPFCTYKIASYLHISQLLQVPCFQSASHESRVTPLVSALTKIGGDT